MKLKKWTDLYSSQPLNLIYCQANMASHHFHLSLPRQLCYYNGC